MSLNFHIYLFKFFGHVQLVQQAYFYEFHFDRVLYNQMCNCVHLHNDVMDRIDRHNGNQSLLKKKENSSIGFYTNEILTGQSKFFITCWPCTSITFFLIHT